MEASEERTFLPLTAPRRPPFARPEEPEGLEPDPEVSSILASAMDMGWMKGVVVATVVGAGAARISEFIGVTQPRYTRCNLAP